MKQPQLLKKGLEKIFEFYKDSPAKQLLHATCMTYLVGGTARAFAISKDKKIEPKQKKYLIPQELADSAANIGLFYLITYQLMKWTDKLFDKKIEFKGMQKFQKGADKLAKGTDKFTREFNHMRKGANVIATLVGVVLSANILTPLIRTHYAAHKQKKALALEEKTVLPSQMPYFKQNARPMPMKTFMALTKNSGMRV